MKERTTRTCIRGVQPYDHHLRSLFVFVPSRPACLPGSGMRLPTSLDVYTRGEQHHLQCSFAIEDTQAKFYHFKLPQCCDLIPGLLVL